MPAKNDWSQYLASKPEALDEWIKKCAGMDEKDARALKASWTSTMAPHVAADLRLHAIAIEKAKLGSTKKWHQDLSWRAFFFAAQALLRKLFSL